MSLSDKLNALVREHTGYDPSVAAAADAGTAKVSSEKSLYYQDLEERAARDGKSIAQVRDEDRAVLANGSFPSSDCLKPDEISVAALNPTNLPPLRREHHWACLYCQGVVATSRPEEALVAQMSRLLAAPPAEAMEPALVPNHQGALAGLGALWDWCFQGLARLSTATTCFAFLLIGAGGAWWTRSGLLQNRWANVDELDRAIALKQDALLTLSVKVREANNAEVDANAKAALAGDQAAQETPFPLSYSISTHSTAIESLSATTGRSVNRIMTEFNVAPDDSAFEPKLRLLWRMGQQAKTAEDAQKVLSALRTVKDGSSNTILQEFSGKAFDDLAFRCKDRWPAAFSSEAPIGAADAAPPSPK